MLTIGDICLSVKTGKRYVVIGHSPFAHHVKVRYAMSPGRLPTRTFPTCDLVGLETGRLQPATVSFPQLMERLKNGDLYL